VLVAFDGTGVSRRSRRVPPGSIRPDGRRLGETGLRALVDPKLMAVAGRDAEGRCR
jgi:hypothetical protein